MFEGVFRKLMEVLKNLLFLFVWGFYFSPYTEWILVWKSQAFSTGQIPDQWIGFAPVTASRWDNSSVGH